MIWKAADKLRDFFKKCYEDNISAFAAQSAFFILLSVIPFLLVFSSLLQYTPVTEAMLMSMVNRIMPEYIAPFCILVIEEVYNQSVGLISVAAVVAIWSAARGVQYLAHGLNIVNNIRETRNWFVLRFWAVLYTVVFGLAIVGMLVLFVFGKSLQDMIDKYIPLVGQVTDMVLRMRSLIMLLILILFFAVIFKMLPNRKVTFYSQLPGAVLCAVAWNAFSFGLSVYVEYFNGFSMYGSMTTIVLIMLWLYFCMLILMTCAEFNVIFEDNFRRWNQKRQNKRKQKKMVDV